MNRLGATRRVSVLVVEDAADTADTVAHLLRTHGYPVRVAADADAALRAAADPPDVVCLDLVRPGTDEWELVRRLRTCSRGRRPLLVAVTGGGREDDLTRSAAAGIDLHLVKPIEPAVLLAVLERFGRLLAAPGEDTDQACEYVGAEGAFPGNPARGE